MAFRYYPTKTIVLLLSVILQFSLISAATDCVCGKRSVKIFDLDVQVPKPDSASAKIEWLNFFDFINPVEGYLMNNDPSRECINYFCRHFKAKVLTIGLGYTVLAPDGPLSDNCEYILTGKIFSVNSNTYQANVEIQTSVSREVVKAVSAQFPLNADSIHAAGTKLGSELSPLRFIIEKFEKAKKTSSSSILIGRYCSEDPVNLLIKPEKQKLNIGDSTTVSIKMTDCDGSPLVGHTIHFDGGSFQGETIGGTQGGTVRPAICTTNTAGNAQVTFIAGQKKMNTAITAWSPFTYPWGREDGVLESEVISIDAPEEYWIANFSYTMEEYVSDSSTAVFVVNPTTNPVTSTTSTESKTCNSIFSAGRIVIIDKPSSSTVDTTAIDLDISEDSIVSYCFMSKYTSTYLSRDMSTSSKEPEIRDYFLRTVDGEGHALCTLSRSSYNPGFSFSFYKKSGSFATSYSPMFQRKRYTRELSYDQSEGWNDTSVVLIDTTSSTCEASKSNDSRLTISDTGFEIIRDTTVVESLSDGHWSSVRRYLYVRLYKTTSGSGSGIIDDFNCSSRKMDPVTIQKQGRNIFLYVNQHSNISSIELFNAAGKKCTFKEAIGGNHIKFSNMPAGLYFVNVKFPDFISPSQKIYKVVIQ